MVKPAKLQLLSASHFVKGTDDVQANSPCIEVETSAQGKRVVLRGVWTAPFLAQPNHWQNLQQSLHAEGRQSHDAFWDLTAIERLDHTGAQLLWNSWSRTWPTQVEADAVQRAMLERAARFSVKPLDARSSGWSALIDALGFSVISMFRHLVDGVRLLGQLVLDLGQLLRHPLSGPWRDISGHIYRIGATALPITALVGFLIGVVLAYLMSQQLRQLGANAFIVNILGIALIRELGPVLAAILIAGRSGSAITAQLGVMRVTEETDAMRVMGIPKGFRLVMPRAIAMAVAMPLISIWTTVAALVGGMLAADVAMGLSPSYFVSALPNAVKVSNLWLATGKSAVFGLLIALIGCHYGLRVKPNTQSLGEGTTASVVTAITMVILVDALFAIVFKGIGI